MAARSTSLWFLKSCTCCRPIRPKPMKPTCTRSFAPSTRLYEAAVAETAPRKVRRDAGMPGFYHLPVVAVCGAKRRCPPVPRSWGKLRKERKKAARGGSHGAYGNQGSPARGGRIAGVALTPLPTGPSARRRTPTASAAALRRRGELRVLGGAAARRVARRAAQVRPQRQRAAGRYGDAAIIPHKRGRVGEGGIDCPGREPAVVGGGIGKPAGYLRAREGQRSRRGLRGESVAVLVIRRVVGAVEVADAQPPAAVIGRPGHELIARRGDGLRRGPGLAAIEGLRRHNVRVRDRLVGIGGRGQNAVPHVGPDHRQVRGVGGIRGDVAQRPRAELAVLIGLPPIHVDGIVREAI